MKKGLILLNAFYKNSSIDHQVMRLKEEFSKLDVDVTVRHNADFVNLIEDNSIQCESFDFDFCIYLDKDKYISEMMERCGIRLFNNHNAILRCDDKMCTYIQLANKGFNIPKTLPGLLCYNPNESITQEICVNIEKHLKYPFVIKECFGSRGEGIYLINDREQLLITLEKVKLKPYLLQEFIRTSYGRDVRVMVIGGTVVGAMLRAATNDFRSNIDLGGKGVKYLLSDEVIKLAENIAKELDLEYCGIDFLFDEQGNPNILCEVNSNAFFAGFEKSTNINVAAKYAEYIYKTMYK